MTTGPAQIFGALARQNAYANDILFQVASTIDLKTLEATTSPSRESAYQLLVHLLAAEINYFAQIRGEGIQMRNKELVAAREEIGAWAARHRQSFLDFVTTLKDEDLSREVVFEFSNKATLRYPVWQLLTQVFLHSAQHRGELSILLSELGHPLPINDVIMRFAEESGQVWPFK